MASQDLLVIAGEASGDHHGALLLKALRNLAPEARPYGLGGEQMQQIGFEPVADYREISVVGLTEVLKILPKAKAIFRRVLEEVDRRGTKTAVLIDFAEFNMRLARELKKRGVNVVYYISPQIWAWRRGRVRQVRRNVERMLVLFPFERDFYREHGVEVVHVGHPLLDAVPQPEHVWDRESSDAERVVALLPGSRRSEVRALFPTMIEAAKLLSRRGGIRPRLIAAPTVPSELFDELLDGTGLEDIERVVGDERRFEALASSHLALCASGTATLEVGLIGTPLVALYRLSPWTAFLARRLVKVDHFSMLNLILDDRVAPELFQEECIPERVAAEADALLDDPQRIRAMRARLAEVRPRLGDQGASERAAKEVVAVMEGAAA